MNRGLIFAIFAVAILVAMLREWSAPRACPLPGVAQNTSAVLSR